ncbi:MAG: HlyD family efflux transporter periplasmic adaptor subunit [Lachnospiraceae bacterium]|nr:HlyD family efflux transporter periplasmic adaptor subunit [Lachnospiraceae bacterium]MDD3615856.1 HlyD family efflux transporter periplasmic adaptor subunit [Lachnospiraceae bacterium]
MAENNKRRTDEKGFSIIKFIKNINFNIGTFIFGALFLYMFISFIIYITTGKITSYQVTSGPLDKNQTYTGFVVRDEQVFSADTSGYITYYAREGTRVKKRGMVYTISDTQTDTVENQLDADSLAQIRSTFEKYALNFDANNFNSVYSLKYDLEGNILQYSGVDTTAIADGKSGTSTITGTANVSSEDGVVLYTKDGYEKFDIDTISADIFNQKSYHKENLKSSEKVDAGSDVYKLVKDENWSVLVALSDKQMAQLAARTSIKVKFLKDGVTQTAGFSIIVTDDGKYGKLDFSSGMIRYINDRYLDVELVTNVESGLKIPISSIVTKEFYTIPEEYESYGDNQNEAGFIKETTDEEGKTVTEFVNTTLYRKADGLCYVEKSDFEEGDRIIKQDSTDRYIIEKTASLEGAYCINKGYAVFRQITIIDQDEEYCIVGNGQDYGLAQFDHIVLNGNTVKEDEILY